MSKNFKKTVQNMETPSNMWKTRLKTAKYYVKLSTNR